MANKKNMAGKMTSKTYTNTRCGHCGKFGHSHETHSGLEKGIKDRKDMIKRNDLSELLNYGLNRGRDKGAEY